MTGEAGAPGTAGDGFRVEPPAGRHRAPPVPPRPDRWTVPLAAAAAILTCASLLAIAGQAVAPDASASASTTTAPTAATTAHTVSVPLEILPATPPSIGASGAWDPETDNPLSAPLPTQTPRSIPVQRWSVATEAAGTTTEAGIDTTEQTDPATTPESTTEPAPPDPSTAAATTTESSATTTEEPTTVTATPTAETVPTDIGAVIDQAIEDAIGETP